MAVPFFWRVRDALKAQGHVQLLVERVDDTATTPGDVPVHGTIARVFRGPAAWLGSASRLSVACLRPGDGPPPSGIAWTQLADLQRARVIEAYVSETDGGLHIVASMSVLLDAVTDEPSMVLTEEDARPPPPPPRNLSEHPLLPALLATIAVAAAGLAGYALLAW